jgi:hypothetical protein
VPVLVQWVQFSWFWESSARVQFNSMVVWLACGHPLQSCLGKDYTVLVIVLWDVLQLVCSVIGSKVGNCSWVLLWYGTGIDVMHNQVI